MIVTVGVALYPEVMVTVMLSESDSPPESVTLAVIVCVPTDRPVEKDTPEPIMPSMLEVQVRLPLRFPSSASAAVPEKLTNATGEWLLPFVGTVIVTTGAVLVIVTVMLSVPDRPPESVTVVVIVCLPTDRLEMEKEPPEPIEPSRSELQVILAARSPSSRSVAVPMKFTEAPIGYELPSGGAVMVVMGAALVIVTVMLSVSVKPSESITEAVIV